MAGHAILSPSSADRWMTCPASVALSAGIEDTGSDAAREGTVAHFLAEQCLVGKRDAKDYLGVEVVHWRDEAGEHTQFTTLLVNAPADAFRFTVDARMVEGVQVYLDYVRALVEATGGELHVEVELPIDHLTGEEGATGTSDVVVLAGKELIVVDLKYGHREIEAIGNRQMRFYGSGALRKYRLVEDFERVRVVIVQPNVSHKPSEWDFSVEELQDFEDEVRGAAAVVALARTSEFPVDYACPSEKACKYCKARPCGVYDKVIQEVTGVTFEGLGEALDKLNLVSDWIKAKEEQAFNALKAGEVVEGKAGPYKLVQGKKGARKWDDEAQVEAAMKASRLKKEEMYSFSIISPAVAEKALKDKPRVWSKLQAHITQAEGGLSIAPANDKRAAVAITPVAEQFDVLA